MKCFISLMVLFSFAFNASANTLNELENILDTHQYTMTVEWDQKDQNFLNAQNEKFIKDIEALIQEGKISSEEVDALIAKKVGTDKLASLKLKLSMSGIKNSQDLAAFMNQNMNDFYTTGASWNGLSTVNLVTAGLLAGFFGLIFFITLNAKRCVRYADEYMCRETESSDGDGLTWVTGRECGYFQVCKEYEQK